MITRVKVKNFRNLADVDVELGPMTVLVGRNGAGKSSFLDVLRFVRDSMRLGIDTAIAQRNGIAAMRRWSPQGRPYDVEVELKIDSREYWGEYLLVISSVQEGNYRIKREKCQVTYYPHNGNSPEGEGFEIRNGKWVTTPQTSQKFFVPSEMSHEAKIELSTLYLPTISMFTPLMYFLREALLDTNFYTIFPNTLREPQKPTNEETLLDDGTNLATSLRKLRVRGNQRSNLLAALGQVAEGVNDVRVRQVGGYLVTELKHDTPAKRPAWFELAQESDGTLRLLALLTALYQDAQQTLIGIEEPELAIHPGALAVLSDVLLEASQRTQVLITTQSPDLISRFKADQLRVVERVNGTTKIGPVDEVQREAINDQLFSAGDLLRIEGLHLTPTAEAA